VYSVLLFVGRFISCWRDPRSCPEPSLYTIIVSVVAAVLGVFFAIFTAAMWFDQYEGLVTNTTGIESMKGWAEERRPLWEGLTEACGEPFSWRWLAPVPLHEDGSCGSNYYAWRADEDPDGYDPRDPMVLRHFRRIEAHLAAKAKEQTKAEAEADRIAAVQAAAEIHRRHAIKKRGYALPASHSASENAAVQPDAPAATASTRVGSALPPAGAAWMPREPLLPPLPKRPAAEVTVEEEEDEGDGDVGEGEEDDGAEDDGHHGHSHHGHSHAAPEVLPSAAVRRKAPTTTGISGTPPTKERK